MRAHIRVGLQIDLSPETYKLPRVESDAIASDAAPPHGGHKPEEDEGPPPDENLFQVSKPRLFPHGFRSLEPPLKSH